MPLPALLGSRLRLPAIAAPLFLASGPDLVAAVCRSGLIGSFPSLNQRSTEAFAAWLDDIEARLAGEPGAAPFAVNLVVHKTNRRLEADLAVMVDHRVPIVITSLGAVPDVVAAVHSYGGLVFHDVISRRHAEKAAAAGVDGIIAVCAGAGGHAGHLNPFALVGEVKSAFGGTVIVGGALSTGRDIAAVRLMGADLAYLGTRFLASRESLAPLAYKEMLTQSQAADIVYTAAITGIPANFIRQSLAANGLDPDHLLPPGQMPVESESKAWRHIWSAGQGVGAIRDIPAAADLCAGLIAEYRAAMAEAAVDPFAGQATKKSN